jgi:hypothetical protein
MSESCCVQSVSSTLLALILGALTLSLVACGSGLPSADSASQVLRSSIDKGSDTRVRLVSFQKTDGQATDTVYELMFTGDAEFVSNAMFSINTPWASVGSQITTAEYKEPSAGFSWDNFLGSSQGFRPAMKGDRLHLTGSVGFQRRESGWVPVGIRFTFEHDTATRDMEAIRVEAERKRAEEAERRRREKERAEEVAREKAERDARAEPIVVHIQGIGKNRYGRGGDYYLGRATSNDVLRIEPLRGRYSEVGVYVSDVNNRWRHGYKPGQSIPDGAIGGVGGRYHTSGPLRIEMRDLKNSTTVQDVVLEFTSDDDMQIRVTILCTREGDSPPCKSR